MKQIRTPLTGTLLSSLASPATDPAGPPHPADELLQLRETLIRLHAREAELLEHFRSLRAESIGRKHPSLKGKLSQIELVEHEKQVFDNMRLPQSILSDRKFYRSERATHIKTKRVVIETLSA